MVQSAFAAYSTVEAVRGLPTRVVDNLRHALQGIEVPCTPEEIELRALVVLGRTNLVGPMEEVARCRYLVKVSPTTFEVQLSLDEELAARSLLEDEIARVPAAFREWAHRLVCELCAKHYLVPSGGNLVRPCDGFPFPPRGHASKAA